MIKIGQYNTLTIGRFVDFGIYLRDNEGHEVLLPHRYITDEMESGNEIEVFIYNDSEDRIIATTEHPYATVGEFAFLQVTAVNRIGAFLNWGLQKDLLVPFREQKQEMRRGGIYPVYIYLDHETKRVVASAKFEKFIGNKFPEYNPGDKVSVTAYAHTEIGYKVVVDNLYNGMIYNTQLFHPITLGERFDAWVNKVRDDGKIDLLAEPPIRERIDSLAENILASLKANGGKSRLSDKSSPEDIQAVFHCSKKDFKKALGSLYKNGHILIFNDHIEAKGTI